MSPLVIYHKDCVDGFTAAWVASTVLPKDTRIYNLRSLPDGPDVSKIARAQGGGGHKHAAGFTVQLP